MNLELIKIRMYYKVKDKVNTELKIYRSDNFIFLQFSFKRYKQITELVIFLRNDFPTIHFTTSPNIIKGFKNSANPKIMHYSLPDKEQKIVQLRLLSRRFSSEDELQKVLQLILTDYFIDYI